MASKKCCVNGCKSTSETSRLFSFPRNDELRKLWLQYMVPTNPGLLKLAKDQLISRRVCHIHFERNQLDKHGNRLINGYPSLFSSKEIVIRMPKSQKDHTYSCNVEKPSSGTRFLMNEDDHIDHDYDHNECMLAAFEAREQLSNKGNLQNTVDPKIENMTSSMQQSQVKPIARAGNLQNTVDPIIKNMTSMQQSQVKPIAHAGNLQNTVDPIIENMTNSMQQSQVKPIVHAGLKIKSVQDLNMKTEESRLLNNFYKMTKYQQTFVKMQLKSCVRNKKQKRYSQDEKVLALTLFKESLEGYKSLQKIFNLPSRKTIRRLSA